MPESDMDDEIGTTATYYADEAATFGDRLMAAREAAGLTQSGLAGRLGVMLKTVRNWENDRSEPRANKLQMLAGIVNVSMAWLITGEGDGIEPIAEEDNMDEREILAELRAVRAESVRLTARIGRLEKQLRGRFA